MSNTKEKLFSEFQSPTTQEWLDKIQVDLKGADFQKRLVWRTPEGFSVQPFYRREDVEQLSTPNALPGQFPYVRGNHAKDNTWLIRQELDAADPAAANAKALDILFKGIDSLTFRIPGKSVSADTVATLLCGIKADIVEVNYITCPRHAAELAALVASYYKQQGYAASDVRGSIAFDPLEKLVMRGRDTEAIIAEAPRVVAAMRDFPQVRCVAVNANALGNAGAYIVQELGYALAWGNEYMQQLTDAGLTADEAAGTIAFYLSVSENYFMEIAKFRAARLLWAQIAKQYGASDEACKMLANAVTTTFNLTLFDPYVNLLRSQTEAMSAALGGVNAMVVTPFDSAYEHPNDFSERLARNQQLLLKEECHMGTVVDPAAGSYYVETLTTSLATEAWRLFLSVEEAGGFLAAAKAGIVQDAVNATSDKRHTLAAQRREFVLGTNQFPNFTETSDGRRPVESACCCAGSDKDCATYKAINTRRLADDFEALRLQTEQAQHQPVAFMLTIGNLAWRQARAQFSCNFLATAGYKVVDNLGFDTVEAGVAAAAEAGADIIVLCSSDDEYAELAVPAFKAAQGKAPLFVVAGAPACADELKAAGIEHFIHVRVNQLDTLRQFNHLLNID